MTDRIRSVIYITCCLFYLVLGLGAFPLWFFTHARAQEPAIPNELDQCRQLARKYKAQIEVRMPDNSRCDMLTDEYAIEVDWAKDKWKESIGQAVLYSIWTKRKPAVLLLVKDQEAEKVDILRCMLVCQRLGIEIFLENVVTKETINGFTDPYGP